MHLAECHENNARAQNAKGLLGAGSRRVLPGQRILNHLGSASYTRIALHTLHAS